MNDKTAVKLASGNYRSPAGRMSYPNVFEVNVQKQDDGSESRKFAVSLAFPKDTDLKSMRDLVDEAAKKRWGDDYKKKVRVIDPFLKTEDYPKMGFDPDEYPVFIRLSCQENRPPNIVRADRTNVGKADAVDEVYGGRWAFVSFNVYTTDHPKGGKRASFGLQNVQLLKHDERIGGAARIAAEDEFESVGEVDGAPVKSTDDLL